MDSIEPIKNLKKIKKYINFFIKFFGISKLNVYLCNVRKNLEEDTYEEATQTYRQYI